MFTLHTAKRDMGENLAAFSGAEIHKYGAELSCNAQRGCARTSRPVRLTVIAGHTAPADLIAVRASEARTEAAVTLKLGEARAGAAPAVRARVWVHSAVGQGNIALRTVPTHVARTGEPNCCAGPGVHYIAAHSVQTRRGIATSRNGAQGPAEARSIGAVTGKLCR